MKDEAWLKSYVPYRNQARRFNLTVPFDVFSYILFTLAPLTREQRSTAVKQTGLSDFADEMRELMVGILETYEIGGHQELSDDKLQQTLVSRFGSVREAKSKLGEVAHIRSSYRTVQKRLNS